jgi:hypothetical protein
MEKIKVPQNKLSVIVIGILIVIVIVAYQGFNAMQYTTK